MKYTSKDLTRWDVYLASDIVERLEVLRNTIVGDVGSFDYPLEYNSMEEWIDTLNEMIEGFRLYGVKESHRPRFERAMKLFSVQFSNLWC